MSTLLLWCIWFALYSAFSYWAVVGKGADFLEGWFWGYFSGRWNTEQIRFYMLCLWIVALGIFIAGLFFSPLRDYYVGDRVKSYVPISTPENSAEPKSPDTSSGKPVASFQHARHTAL